MKLDGMSAPLSSLQGVVGTPKSCKIIEISKYYLLKGLS